MGRLSLAPWFSANFKLFRSSGLYVPPYPGPQSRAVPQSAAPQSHAAAESGKFSKVPDVDRIGTGAIFSRLIDPIVKQVTLVVSYTAL
jgi:hypothetical protein